MSGRAGRACDALEAQLAFEEEFLAGEAADLIAALLAAAGISQRELAERLGVSEARVSQITSGSGNLTLRSLATLGWALGVRFRLVPVAIEDRLATPAADDPPLPRWMSRLQKSLGGSSKGGGSSQGSPVSRGRARAGAA